MRCTQDKRRDLSRQMMQMLETTQGEAHLIYILERHLSIKTQDSWGKQRRYQYLGVFLLHANIPETGAHKYSLTQ